MFQKGEIKQALLGCLEIPLFMPQGAKRFRNDREAMVRSFGVLLLATIPFLLIMIPYKPLEPGMESMSVQVITALYCLRSVLAIAFGIAFSFMFLRVLKKEDCLFRLITASNWLSVSAAVLTLPLAILLATGMQDWEALYPVMIVLSVYSYIWTAFLVTYVVKIPWELAGFFVIFGMFIDETLYDILYWFAGVV